MFYGLFKEDKVHFIIRGMIIVILFFIKLFNKFFFIWDFFIDSHSKVNFHDISPEYGVLENIFLCERNNEFSAKDLEYKILEPDSVFIIYKTVSKNSTGFMNPESNKLFRLGALLWFNHKYSLENFRDVSKVECIVKFTRDR
jgi:hypothetical protein